MTSPNEPQTFGGLVQDCVDWVLIDPASIIENKAEPISVAYVVVQDLFSYLVRGNEDSLDSLWRSSLLDTRMVREALQWFPEHYACTPEIRERIATARAQLNQQ